MDAWKILEGIVPNCGINKSESLSERAGRQCSIPKVKSTTRQSLKTLRSQSFQVHGPQLFNALPLHIRNMSKCCLGFLRSFEQITDKKSRNCLTP